MKRTLCGQEYIVIDVAEIEEVAAYAK